MESVFKDELVARRVTGTLFVLFLLVLIVSGSEHANYVKNDGDVLDDQLEESIALDNEFVDEVQASPAVEEHIALKDQEEPSELLEVSVEDEEINTDNVMEKSMNTLILNDHKPDEIYQVIEEAELKEEKRMDLILEELGLQANMDISDGYDELAYAPDNSTYNNEESGAGIDSEIYAAEESVSASSDDSIPVSEIVNTCKLKEMGIQFACNPGWKVMPSEEGIERIVVKEEPLITLSVQKLEKNLRF